MEPLTPIQAGVLEDVLREIHLRSALYCRAHMKAPWGLGVPRRDVATFHLVAHGTCWLTIDGVAGSRLLGEGDLVILPHGHAHVVADQSDTPVTLLEDFVTTHAQAPNGLIYAEGDGATTGLVCGGLELDDYPTNPLYALLPACLHLKRHHGGQTYDWINALVGMVRAEVDGSQPGAEAVIRRISELLWVQAIREYLRDTSRNEVGWFGALRDAQVGPALALILRRPEEPWTVASLARQVGLSRSALAAKFTRLVGMPLLHYLTDVRLTKAAALLRTQSATLIAVALSVGYTSEVALSKAFKRRYGIAPGAYRHGVSPVRATPEAMPSAIPAEIA